MESTARAAAAAVVEKKGGLKPNLIPDVTTPGWRQVELDNLTSVLDTMTSSSSNFSGKPANANVYSYFMFYSSWEGNQA